jgi:hypothetical protein
MIHHYTLNEMGEPVAEPDLLTWARWFEASGDRRIVRQEMVGDSRVSTVFLGLDHSFGYGAGSLPVLWETMVFGGALDREGERCAGNREQAEAMHERMVEIVKRSTP